jgi:hypothetical protein
VVLNPSTNNEIWVDPVLPLFNNKKQYNYKIDKKINMALIAVAGVGKVSRSKAEKTKRRAELKAKVKASIKKRGKLLIKFNPATASARNAALLLIKVNLFGLAHKLFQLRNKPNGEAKLKKFWEKIGGNYSNLTRNINEGIKKGKNKEEDRILSDLAKTKNSVGNPFVAAITAATPIILKLKALLKDAGIDPAKLATAAKGLLKKAVNDKIDQFANDKATKEEGGNDAEYNSKGIPEPQSEPIENAEEATSNDEGESVEGIPTNKLLIGAAIIGGAYLLLKKK